MKREAKFAGSWYPDKLEEAKKYLPCISEEQKIEVISCICPHAGWMYSGKVAGAVYSLIKPADIYILVGPNHTGFGENISIYPSGQWQTPFGKIQVNSELVELIVKNSEFVKKDTKAHENEHSLEVQLPFLQFISPADFTIVPITVRIEDYHMCKDLGAAISVAIKEYKKVYKNKKIVIISSTDMTHYESQSYAQKLDFLAIEQILKLSPKELYDTVLSYGITMCGVFPTVSTLVASKLLNANNAKLVKYQTSGDVTGEYDSVVGYAGIVIFNK
ncbi:MAG: AmmeMemoRadiSam system protein B [Endomicrobia bacterium]|nr:AmmeMemoRadiSam system protein B [Endomicrobiia bacterium]MCX7715917.1 AmmeMemoRadiSam system protein B [Endomicrobiia bacterium]